MMKMRLYISVFIAPVLATIGGCATGPKFNGDVQFGSNPEIVVVRAIAHQKFNGILVGGDVRRTNGYAGTVPGYLEVEGRDVSGVVVARAKAPWGEFINRRFRLAYFKAFLPTDEPRTIVTIRIAPVTRHTIK